MSASLSRVEDLERIKTSDSWPSILTDLSLSDLESACAIPFFESSLINWLAQTGQHTDAPVRYAFTDVPAEQALSRLVATAFGRFLCVCAPERLSFPTLQAGAQTRAKVLSAQSGGPDLDVRQSAILMCADHLSSGLSPQLYTDPKTGKLIGTDAFVHVLFRLVEAVAPVVGTEDYLAGRSSELAALLFELFENTHKHARRGVDDVHLRSSVRGIYTRFYDEQTVRALTSRPQDKGPLLDPVERYCSRILHDANAQHTKQTVLGFLEISVFDCGPGFPSKYLGHDATRGAIGDELKAALECFEGGATSLPTRSSGHGLVRVLKIVRRQKGFLRLRTSRLHLYRDFQVLSDLHLEKHGVRAGDPKPQLLDWTKGVSSQATTNVSTTGSLVSTMLPVYRK